MSPDETSEEEEWRHFQAMFQRSGEVSERARKVNTEFDEWRARKGSQKTVEELHQLVCEAERFTEEYSHIAKEYHELAKNYRLIGGEQPDGPNSIDYYLLAQQFDSLANVNRQLTIEYQRSKVLAEEYQRTTLDEHLALYHIARFSKCPLKIDPGRGRSSSIPRNTSDKWCPRNLRPWSNFIDQQRRTFGTLYNLFPVKDRVFPSKNEIVTWSDRKFLGRSADEDRLRDFLHCNVECPVQYIIEELNKVEEARAAFNLGRGIIFEDPSPALTDIAGVDLTCVARSEDEDEFLRTMVYVAEYKSPNKLSVQHLRAGLRPMNIYREILNRRAVPTSEDPDTKFRYQAERLSVSAITQTYHYMIQNGLEYGNLSICEATVFLKIDWSKPETLYYHLTEPISEVLAHPNNIPICTAIGQHLAFMLMALGSPGEQLVHGQTERHIAMKRLTKWNEDFEAIVRSIPKDEWSPSSETSPYCQPTTYKDVERSPYLEISEEQTTPRLPDTPAAAGQSTKQGSHLCRGDETERGSLYCTQKCLVGLVSEGYLDPECPNVALHRKRKRCHARARHPVNHVEWHKLLMQQLERSLDDGIISLGHYDPRHVYFRMTLLAYGYTFIARSTVQAYIKGLKHESAVYRRLKPIQGCFVPVFLGSICLKSMNRVYHYWHRVDLEYLNFYSWAGIGFSDACELDGNNMAVLRTLAFATLRALHREGVVLKDFSKPLMLFNKETDTAMILNFEGVVLLKPPQYSSARPVRIRCGHRISEKEEGEAEARLSSRKRHEARLLAHRDVVMMKRTFP